MLNSNTYLLRSLLYCFLLFTFLPGAGFSQSQGQAGSEYLEFQRVEGEGKVVKVRAEDGILVPDLKEDGSLVRVSGKITSFTDSTIAYRRTGSDAVEEVNLNEAPYVTVEFRKHRIAGGVLVSLGLASVLGVLVYAILTASTGSGFPFFFVVLVTFLWSVITFPLTWILLGVGLFVLLLGSRKLVRGEWRRRLVRQVFVRKSRGRG